MSKKVYNSVNEFSTYPVPSISLPMRERQLVRYLYEHQDERFNIRAYSKITGIPRSSVYDTLNRLIKKTLVFKDGPGAFKISEAGNNLFRDVGITLRNSTPFITSRLDNTDTPKLNRAGVVLEVRGHGFRFLVKLPRLTNWSRRREFMLTKGIKFKVIQHGESIVIRGHKVKLYNKSLDIYFAKGWSSYAPNSEESWKYAIMELRNILKEFEVLFGCDLRRVSWRVSKQHFSLVKNVLAKDYLSRREKLQVFAEDGKLWMLIDNSFNLEELETVHTQTAKDDNKKVQEFMNGVRDTGITPGFILQSLDSLIKDRAYYAENLRHHTDAINTLDKQIERLGDILVEFTNKK